MNAIEELRALHFRVRTGLATWQDCVSWGIERLRNDDEGDDLDVVMLAAAIAEDEALALTKQILERYLGEYALTGQVFAGKLIVALYEAYKSGRETASSLDSTFSHMYAELNNPSWLVMLARNCEYAMDVSAFQQPFEEEFEYIASLWRDARDQSEFDGIYDSRISKSHDLPAIVQRSSWWKLW